MLFSREKNFVRGDENAIRALKTVIRSYSEWLGNRCREDGELVESAKVFLKGYRETGNLWLLGKTAAIGIPDGFRHWLRQLIRAHLAHSESAS